LGIARGLRVSVVMVVWGGGKGENAMSGLSERKGVMLLLCEEVLFPVVGVTSHTSCSLCFSHFGGIKESHVESMETVSGSAISWCWVDGGEDIS
jgi:hypothetical protein